MPCLSSSAVNALNESIRVSNAESQFALPLAMTTFLGASMIDSPKASAVWTEGAGVCSAAGAGEGLAAGAGLVDGAGSVAGLAEGVGVGEADGACASVAPTPSQIAAAEI